MKVETNRDWINRFVSVQIDSISVDEYTEIIFILRIRLETLETELEEYKEKEHLKEFLPRIQKEHLQVKKLIENMQG